MANWRIELGAFKYETKYKPGKENVVADALTRVVYVGAMNRNLDELKRLHQQMCHSGITRLLHLVKAPNLPFSMQDVEQVCQNCRICCEWKPRFFKPGPGKLTKATQP